jgi:hypothetical protein
MDKKFDNKYNEGYNKISLAIQLKDKYEILYDIPGKRRGQIKISYTEKETFLEVFVRNYVTGMKGEKRDFLDWEDKILYEDTLDELRGIQQYLNDINNEIKRVKNDEEKSAKIKNTEIDILINLFNQKTLYLYTNYNIIICFSKKSMVKVEEKDVVKDVVKGVVKDLVKDLVK